MSVRKICAVCLPVLVYGLFLAELILVIRHPVRCPYERTVSEYSAEFTQAQKEEYVCGLDRHEVNEGDLFRTAEVSGWLVQKENGRWKPVAADILLESADKSYKVHSYSVKRSDVYYMDQSDSDSKDLYVGHLSRFPAAVLEAGEYKIGFLIEENREPAVYWTEETIVIPQ